LACLTAASASPFPVRNPVIPKESVSICPRSMDRATKDSSGMTVHLTGFQVNVVFYLVLIFQKFTSGEVK
jgi:hypothetical protein